MVEGLELEGSELEKPELAPEGKHWRSLCLITHIKQEYFHSTA